MHPISVTSLTRFFLVAEPTLCLLALFAIYKRGQLRSFWFLGTFLGLRAASVLSGAWILGASTRLIEPHLAYKIYFYMYWSSYAIEAILGFVMIYGLYNLAMKPLPGLQRLGRLMFRWAAGIGLALSAAMAFGPQVSSGTFAIRLISQLQQTQSVLTLCLLFFVCLAVRPMGLSARSKIFGVSLGLGVMATYDLVQSSWLSHMQTMNSFMNVIGGAATIFALSIWVGYFAAPEPKRRMIMLPTTSPFLRWNQISAALNDAPGFVALGEVTEDMFAPAEVEIMHRASAKIAQAVA
jgi:hypothetical protein